MCCRILFHPRYNYEKSEKFPSIDICAALTMRFSNDPSEEMILQNEWRRDRMHQAVDEVESQALGTWWGHTCISLLAQADIYVQPKRS
jgi:hypothetical protein